MKRLQRRLCKTHSYYRAIGLCILMIALFSGCAGTKGTLSDGTLQGSLSVESTDVMSRKTASASAESGQKESDPADAGLENAEGKSAQGQAENALSESEEEAAGAGTEYRIVMVGDVLLHTPVEESCRKPDGSYDYDSLFTHTKDEISAADLALVNQEVIIGGSELGISGYPCFNADFSLCDTLVRTGFNVICHATNHAMDKGRAGLISCAQHWREQYCLRFFNGFIAVNKSIVIKIYLERVIKIFKVICNYMQKFHGILPPFNQLLYRISQEYSR